jgi:hypothetical protein
VGGRGFAEFFAERAQAAAAGAAGPSPGAAAAGEGGDVTSWEGTTVAILLDTRNALRERVRREQLAAQGQENKE